MNSREWQAINAAVTLEDLVMFINACFACSGQREFYSDHSGHSVSIDFLHRYILGNYRRLYARTLASGINHFNQSQIIINLLASGRDVDPADREEEGQLIRQTLRALPPQRALRTLDNLRQRRVNNRRTRAVIRDYLASRRDPAFDAVKYRNRIRGLASHAHLRFSDERGAFLFRGWKKRQFETQLFETFRSAHYAKARLYDLPYTIAAGLAAKHNIPQDEFLAGIKGRMTANEKLRLQQSAARSEVGLEIDLARVSPTRLCTYLLSRSIDQRNAERERFSTALQESARRFVRRTSRKLGRVAAVLDRSYSCSGSTEKRRRPLAVALATSMLLREAADEYRAFWTPGLDDELLATARGQTDLASPLLDALEWNPELVVIVSDGYENDPPSGAAEVARIFRKRLDPQRRTSVVHMNPVFDARHYAPKTIGPAIPTVGLRDAEDLFTMLGFARFAEGSAPLSELEQYLTKRVDQLLGRDAGEGPP